MTAPAPATPPGRLEGIIARFAPGWALSRAKARADLARMERLRAGGAYSTSGRQNASIMAVGETQQSNRERTQLMLNAVDLIDNSGLGDSITDILALYVAGRLRYQARTGDKVVNQEYEDTLKERFKSCIDITGRHSLREIARLSVRGQVVKGGVCHDIVRPEPDCRTVHLRPIEYDRLGSPYEVGVRGNYVGGITIDELGREQSFRIFRRDRVGGMYHFEEEIPKLNAFGSQQFIHLFNPRDFDGYKGRTAFGNAIDLIHYIHEIRQLELETMQWASSQAGVYYTESKELPPRPFDNGDAAFAGGGEATLFRQRFSGVENQALGTAERVELFKNDRTHPNVLAMLTDTVKHVCLATGLPFQFVYGMDSTGPGVRFTGKQADRVFGVWWDRLVEQFLTPVVETVLLNEIAQGTIPYHPRWNRGRWFGPQKSSIDAGDDSAAALNEMAEGVLTADEIAAARGEDIEEIQEQRAIEVGNTIKLAKKIALEAGVPDWQTIYPMLVRGANAAGGFQAAATQKDDPEKAGATTGGAVMP